MSPLSSQANLAFDPAALLPGASPKSPGLKAMVSPFHSPPSTPSSPGIRSHSGEAEEVPVSFDQPPEGTHLPSYNKVSYCSPVLWCAQETILCVQTLDYCKKTFPTVFGGHSHRTCRLPLARLPARELQGSAVSKSQLQGCTLSKVAFLVFHMGAEDPDSYAQSSSANTLFTELSPHIVNRRKAFPSS